MNPARFFFFCRTSEIFQSALMWPGHRVDGWRMVDGNGEHEHVHLRNRPGVHSHGKRGVDQNEGNYRVEWRRLDFRTG